MLYIRTRHFVAQPGKTLAQALEIVWILNLRRTLNMYQHYQYIYIIQYPIPSTPKADHRCTISLQVPYFGDHQIPGIELTEVVRLKQSEATSRGKRKTPEP